MKSKNTTSPIQKVKNPRKKMKDAAFARLWAKAAGRCEFCNRIVYEDSETTEDNNNAQIAHIVAFSENGPRGDEELSKLLDGHDENVMLLCAEHHHLIDHEGKEKYSVEILRQMKHDHEERVRLVTELKDDRKTECLSYTAVIGDKMPTVSDADIRNALWHNRRYPKSRQALRIMGNNGVKDWDPDYWSSEEKRLVNEFNRLVDNGSESEGVHYSIFALAPQPLLVKLGALLGSLRKFDVYQRNRDTQSWAWQDEGSTSFIFDRPECADGKAVFILALSATAIINQVKNQLKDSENSFWVLSADNPGYNCITNKEQLAVFRSKVEDVLDDIRSRSKASEIHVFMAVPCSCAVEFGRAWMSKADLPLVLYNLNPEENKYINVLTIKA